MSLCYLSSLSYPSPALCAFVSSPKLAPFSLKWSSHQNPSRRNPIPACSAEKSSKKGKTSKRTKSNQELCDELREFVSAAKLPAGHVPSLKELTEHGRKDLANVVRRRGYRVIAELLRMSAGKGPKAERNLLGDQEKSNDDIDESSESSSSLHLKATSIISTGVLDTVEGDCDLNMDMPTEAKYNFHISNCNGPDRVSVATEQVPDLMEQHQDRDNTAPCEELESVNFTVDLTSDMVGERNNQMEIDQLKAMLHQKEMELSMLRQQLEKDKEALSVLQATTNVEIDNIHRNILAKDMELNNAVESLSGLKEVQIEYWEDGETVEVAGSFNGWHHPVKLDLHSSNNTINPTDSRISKLWSTVLWLYPGMYQIKFIVDGHWRIDSQRETVTIGNITNNVLRVDR